MLNCVIYRVPQCQKVLAPFQKFRNANVIYWGPQPLKVWAPNLQKVPQCEAAIYRVPWRVKVWAPNLPKVPECKHCYLQGSTKIKGSIISPKPPRSSAMPNTVICRAPHRLTVLASNLPKVSQSFLIYMAPQRLKGFDLKAPKSSAIPHAVIYRAPPKLCQSCL